MDDETPFGKLARLVLLGGCLPAVAGAIILPLLEFARDTLFYPQLLNDGLYILLPAMVAPQGLWVGYGVGAAIALYKARHYHASIVAVCLCFAALAAVGVYFALPHASYGLVQQIMGLFGISLSCAILSVIVITPLALRQLRRLSADGV